MCGIIGYIGEESAAPILIKGLKRLEYRGYDSAGIAVLDDNRIKVEKYKGRLQILDDKTKGGESLAGKVGIAHTRWATHGKPSDENSHPHVSASKKFAVVHNGIIENYMNIKNFLVSKGYEFASETDTEVIAHLIDYHYKDNFLDAVIEAAKELSGSYALGLVSSAHPDEIIAVKHSSPLIIGMAETGVFMASDITAFLNHTRDVYRLADGEIAVCRRDGIKFYDMDKNAVEKTQEKITWDVQAAEKGGYEHFMLKEIMEEPEALNATISPRLGTDGNIVLDGVRITREELEKVRQINIVACGSAYHAGIVGKTVIERLTGIPVIVDIASEFRYSYPIINKDSLVIIISQSGETADTLAAVREAKARGARVLSIVNVVGSSIATESHDVLYTWAGPEISVATTKGYSTQLAMLYIVAAYIAQTLELTDAYKLRGIIRALNTLPSLVEKILKSTETIEEVSKKYSHVEHAYFIGRNIDYAVSLEASLKLKEISYIHSEAYAAGELKHGTISLIEDQTFVVALCCCDRLLEKTMSNIKEVKARGASVLALTIEGNTGMEKDADHVIYIPETHELLMPSLEVVPMQLLGYYMAKARGCDIDKPRNLAKSVTVE